MPPVSDDPLDSILSRDQIRTLLSVVEHGSFHRAAVHLDVRQPAVNQLVKRLEDKLGRRLFDRTSAGVTLTVDGEALLIYARAIAQLGEKISQHFRGAAADTALRVGIGEEFSRTSLPAVLGLFGQLHNQIRLEAVCTVPGDALFGLLDDGWLDVVIARQQPGQRPGEAVWTEPTMWAGRRGLEMPLADPVPLVLPAPGVLRNIMLRAMVASSRSWRVTFEGGSLSVLEAAVQGGLGVTACSARLDLQRVVPLGKEAGLPDLEPSTFVLERRRSPRVPAADAFCDVLQTAARLSFAGDAAATVGGDDLR